MAPLLRYWVVGTPFVWARGAMQGIGSGYGVAPSFVDLGLPFHFLQYIIINQVVPKLPPKLFPTGQSVQEHGTNLLS